MPCVQRFCGLSCNDTPCWHHQSAEPRASLTSIICVCAGMLTFQRRCWTSTRSGGGCSLMQPAATHLGCLHIGLLPRSLVKFISAAVAVFVSASRRQHLLSAASPRLLAAAGLRIELMGLCLLLQAVTSLPCAPTGEGPRHTSTHLLQVSSATGSSCSACHPAASSKQNVYQLPGS